MLGQHSTAENPGTHPRKGPASMNIPNTVEASILLVAGTAGTWLGLRSRRAAARTALVGRLRWLWPALLLLGVWQLGSALTAAPPGITAEAIASALRKKFSPPWMIDGITRGDSVGSVGKHVILRATITRPSSSEADRERVLHELFNQARIHLCRNEPTRTWLEQGIGFEYEYTMDGKTYSPVIIVQKDCE